MEQVPVTETQPFNDDTADILGVGVRIGLLNLFIAAPTHCEIVEHPQISQLPHVKRWFKGLLNLHGTIVPVIDVHDWLNQAAPMANKTKWLAIGQGEKTVAINLDGYPEMMSVSSFIREDDPPLPVDLQSCYRATVQHDRQTWYLIDPHALGQQMGRSLMLSTEEQVL